MGTNIIDAQTNIMGITSAFFRYFSNIFKDLHPKGSWHVYIYIYWCMYGFGVFYYLDCIPLKKISVLSSGTCVSHYKWKLSYYNTQGSGFESTVGAEHAFLRQGRLLVASKPLLFFTPVALIFCLTPWMRRAVKHDMRRRGRERGHSWAFQKA